MMITAIQVRYAKEAHKTSCLSCGGALGFARVQKEEVLADLGSGRGRDVLMAAQQGKFAYGIDFTSEMTEAATAKSLEQEIPNAKFLLGSIDNIPLDDNFIDVVISNCTINHAPDKQGVFGEIYRILKPGGRFIVSDIIAETEIPEEIAANPEAIAQCYAGAIVKEKYFNAIKISGFDNAEILEESLPYDKHGVMVKSITVRSYKKQEIK